MKILSAAQIRALDQYTIQHEPIASIDLMERAALTFTRWFMEKFPDTDRPVQIFCGIGNNGGDGLAIGRQLQERFYNVGIVVCKISENTSEDFQTNYQRLPLDKGLMLSEIAKDDRMPAVQTDGIVIDAIFGSGLNRPVEGYWAKLIEYINADAGCMVAVDIPSGMFADQHTDGISIEADRTFTFQLPKLAFFFPENLRRVGDWDYGSIGLSPEFLEKVKADNYYLERSMAKSLLKDRHKYDHKGTFGHAMLICGSYGKVGAAVLAARACLRSGVGLLTIHAPRCAYEILQISVPEAMVSIDRHQHYFSEAPEMGARDAIGIGCGLDQRRTTIVALLELIEQAERPLVIDADALNILSKHPAYLAKLPKNSILTPHPKEFERLFGKTSNDFERNDLQRRKAGELGIIIVLKGAHTCVALPDRTCYFNATGNPGMATGGSGDVLTGIITGLLAQPYSPQEAALLGVYIHGLAGDIAAEELEHESLIAGDIVQYLGKAFMRLKH